MSHLRLVQTNHAAVTPVGKGGGAYFRLTMAPADVIRHTHGMNSAAAGPTATDNDGRLLVILSGGDHHGQLAWLPADEQTLVYGAANIDGCQRVEYRPRQPQQTADTSYGTGIVFELEP